MQHSIVAGKISFSVLSFAIAVFKISLRLKP